MSILDARINLDITSEYVRIVEPPEPHMPRPLRVR